MDITLSRDRISEIAIPLAWVVTFAVVASIAYYLIPVREHWQSFFRPATLSFLSGQSPYNIQFNGAGIYNPPWVFVVLAPFALLPVKLGNALLAAANLLAFAFVAKRRGAKAPLILAFVLSPLILYMSMQINIDWLAAIGFIMPAPIGLFFVSMKPQVGIGVALYWMAMSYKSGGLSKVAKTFLPVSLLLLLSIAIYGPWPLQALALQADWNTAAFPYTLSIGLVLLVTAIKKERIGYAIAAAPFLSPYVADYSWWPVALGFMPAVPETLAAIAGMWLIQFAIPLF